MSQQQPYNPNNFTSHLGQRAAEFTATELERLGMGGQGFIGGAQNKLIGQQVGAFVTNEVNELFHIQNAQGSGQAQPQSGVRNFISNEVGQIFHRGKDEEGGVPSQNPQNKEGFFDEAADFVMYEAKQVFHSRGGKDGHPGEVQTVTQVTKTVTTDGGHPGSHVPTTYQQQVTHVEHQYEPTHEPQNFNSGGGPGSHIPSGGQTGPRDNEPQQSYGGYQGQQQQNYGGYQGQQQQNYGGYQGQQQQNYGGYQGQQQQNYGGYQEQQQNYGNQGQQQNYGGTQQRSGEDDEEGGWVERTSNTVKGFFNKD